MLKKCPIGHFFVCMSQKVCIFALYFRNNKYTNILWQNLLSKNRYAAIRWQS